MTLEEQALKTAKNIQFTCSYGGTTLVSEAVTISDAKSRLSDMKNINIKYTTYWEDIDHLVISIPPTRN